MGSENSKSSNHQERKYTDRAIAEALERQRRLYEAKCEEIRNAQMKSNAVIIEENRINRNNEQQNTSPPVKLNTPSAALYPNLRNIDNNNVQSIADYSQINCPNTSRSAVFPNTLPVVTTPTGPTLDTIQVKDNKCPPQSRNGPRLPMKSMTALKASKCVCVSCKNDLSSKIYNCLNGHSSCVNCKLNDSPCGICSQPITNMRNITLEVTISEMKLAKMSYARVPCRNASDGCSLHFKKTELKEHLKECPYNDLICPMNVIFDKCSWKGKLHHISSHFNDTHPETLMANVGQEMLLSDTISNRRVLHFINMSTNQFLVHIETNTNQKVIYVAVQLFGAKIDAEKWVYELHVYNKKEPRRKYQYVDVCHSNVTPIPNIFNENKCAVLSLTYAQTFFGDNGIHYKIYLKKKNIAQ